MPKCQKGHQNYEIEEKKKAKHHDFLFSVCVSRMTSGYFPVPYEQSFPIRSHPKASEKSRALSYQYKSFESAN